MTTNHRLSIKVIMVRPITVIKGLKTVILRTSVWSLVIIQAACQSQQQESVAVAKDQEKQYPVTGSRDAGQDMMNHFDFYRPGLPKMRWIADTVHSSIQFRTRHTTVHDVIGWIRSYDIVLYADQPDFSDAVAEGRADLTTIEMPNPEMAVNLQRPEMFDVENHRYAYFRSDGQLEKGENQPMMPGIIEVKGKTKKLPLKVTFNGYAHPQAQGLPGFTIEGKFSRFDFGVGNRDTLANGGVAMLDDTIYFTCNLRMYSANR